MPRARNGQKGPGSDSTGLFLIAMAERLQIETEWIQHEKRGFRWWPGALAQRVWADPIRTVGRHTFSRIHIESDFLRDLPETEKTIKMVAFFNRVAVLSSALLNPANRRICFHASVCVSEDNADEMLRLASFVVANQAADASAKSVDAPELFNAVRDTSSHPSSGVRTEGHGMLLALEVIRRRNQDCEPASRIDFSAYDELDPRPWLLGFGGVGGLTAEFAYSGNRPAVMAAAAGLAPETSLLQLTTDFEHPQLGHGVLIRLTLPMNGDANLANTLNLREASDGAQNADQLGGWCDADNGLTFVSFLPSCMVDDDWLASLMYDHNIRSIWARGVLSGSQK